MEGKSVLCRWDQCCALLCAPTVATVRRCGIVLALTAAGVNSGGGNWRLRAAETEPWIQLTDQEATVLLIKAAEVNKHSYQALENWSGTGSIFIETAPRNARMKASLPLPAGVSANDVVRQYVGRFEFVCDCTGDRLFCKYIPDKALVTGRGGGGSLPIESEWNERWTLLLPTESFTLRPFEKTGDLKQDPSASGWSSVRSRVVRQSDRRTADRFALLADVVDPRLAFRVSGKPFYEELSLLAQSIEHGRPASVERAGREGTIYRALCEIAGKQFRFTFDEACGFNLVKYEERDVSSDVVRNQAEVRFEIVSDVFVPREFSRTMANEDGVSDYAGVLRSDELQVNQGVDDSAFTLASFDLDDGDRILDVRTDELRVFTKGSGVLSVTKFEDLRGRIPRRVHSTGALKPAPDGSLLPVLLVINAVVLVTLAVIVVARRMRTRVHSRQD